MKRHNGTEWDAGGRWTDANNAESRIASLEAERDELMARLTAVKEWQGKYNDEDFPLEATYLQDLSLTLAGTTPCPGCAEKDAAIVNCYDTLEKRNEECAEKDKRLERVREARAGLREDVRSLLKEENWKAYAGILGKFRDNVDTALNGAEEQEEG